jgi:hypothetical protein
LLDPANNYIAKGKRKLAGVATVGCRTRNLFGFGYGFDHFAGDNPANRQCQAQDIDAGAPTGVSNVRASHFLGRLHCRGEFPFNALARSIYRKR